MDRKPQHRDTGSPPAARDVPWMQRVGKYAAVPDLIRQLGGDPTATLIAAGLSLDALDDPNRRVPYAAICRMLQQAAAQTRCAHFGLLAGRMWQLADLGLVGELARHSPTVGRALKSIVVHHRLNSTGGLGFMIERGASVELGYAIYHPGLYDTAQLYDTHLSGMVNFMRELAGNEWVPDEAFLPHAKPETRVPYRTFLKVQPKFNAEMCAIRFPATWLRQPVAGADPSRLRAAQERLRLLPQSDFHQQVYRALRTMLLHDRHAGDDLAQMLSMHRRTLNRRLRAAGTTFQAVLDQVRYDVARQFLYDSEIPLDDIAASLGYAGVTPFMRTFRRWSGTTPAKWRRAAAELRAAAADPVVEDARRGVPTSGLPEPSFARKG